jgi:prepilin-type N-terminal cleavage/methylation domain-containing protein
VKRAFTLIELLVVVAISLVLVGGVSLGATKFLSREHLVSTGNELLSDIKMARNYAITSQKPAGYAAQLDYVAVTMTAGGQLAIWPVNLGTSGPSYFSKNVSSSGVVLTPINYGEILFSVPEGKLLVANGQAPADVNYLKTVTVSSAEGVAETMTISVDAGGKIW